MEKLLDNMKLVIGENAGADINDTNPVSDAIRSSAAEDLYYLRIQTATTGTAVITCEACSAADGTGATAIAFAKYEMDSAGSPVDTISAEAAVAAAGFTTATSKSMIYLLRVPRENIPAAKPFVRFKFTEGVNAPVIGAGAWLMHKPRFSPVGSVIA